MGLLSKQFVILVLFANIISVPLALLTLTRWLQDFAFRIQPDWPIFMIAGAAALLCAVVPILLQASWAARADPVESLRYE
jgi:putative ABC transport system permease protein